MSDSLERINTFATSMVEIFIANTKVISVSDGEDNGKAEAFVSDEGLNKLGDIFNEVPIGLRAGVYSVFLDKLTESGLPYDIEQFKGPVH